MGFVTRESRGALCRIVMNRPETRNAFDEAMIAELREAFGALPGDARAVVLAAEGPAFCAGGDAAWMRRSKEFSPGENRRDAGALAAMLQAVEACPVPVIARVQGPAMGGGAGLVAACDVAVCSEDAVFAFPEVRLGLVPAVISLAVLPRIGVSAARRWFLTGERFGAAEAKGMGLVHEVVPAPQLEARVEGIAGEILKGAPQALREAKKLLRTLPGLDRDAAARHVVDLIAEIRTGPEAQEGLAAFLEKRPPRWP
jgi:methylglutaconyl-CoA hydratase